MDLKHLSKLVRTSGNPLQANEIDMALRLLTDTQRDAIERAIDFYMVQVSESRQSGLGEK